MLAQSFCTELWNAHQGDSILRLDYDLNADSIVFDVGGYEGSWTADIVRKFSCNVHVFEPVGSFADRIENRFLDNPKIKLHRFGLGGQTRKDRMIIAADSSSIFGEGEGEEVLIVAAAEFIEKNGIKGIDLMKINIEGSEYELLEHLIQTGLISRIDNMQIQFHDIVPRASERMGQIQQALRRTHYITYQYEFVWENWRKRVFPDTVTECRQALHRVHGELDSLAKKVLLHQRGLISAKIDTEGLNDKLKEAKVQLEVTQRQLEVTRGLLEETKGQLGETQGQLGETQGQLEETRNSLAIAKLELSSPKLCLLNASRVLYGRLLKWTKPR
jgi:FkbM family methyltransferase